MNKEINFFAKTNFRNQECVFGIKTDDRRRHIYVIGKTGMGKTNLLENMVVQDIRNGKGVCYIDPHGDTAEKLIKAIPSNRINDVIYLNPADQGFPLAFNVMEAVDPEYRHLVASGLIGVFKKIWADSWGPRLEYILRNAILALLEYPGSTLLGVTRILVDKKYREKVIDKVTDPVVKQFWIEEFSKWNDRVLQEVISPIQNKVGQFLSSSLIRNIVGQTKSSFDIRDIMDSQKILILNLSKGRIGEDNSALLGAMMITKIQLAAMGRVDMPEEERKDFYLYVDEFQNFATESFANILSEARKYHLDLVLANQYITQIDERVRDAIFGNAGTIISFRVGATDAEFLEKEFAPVFVQNDIVNLPKYQIYLKLMIDGIAGDAFSATTLPPVFIEDTKENEEKVITISRERYASSKAEVEEKIAKWAGMMPTNGFKTINGVAEQPVRHQTVTAAARPQLDSQVEIQKQAQKISQELKSQPIEKQEQMVVPDERPKFEAVCDMCGTQIQVPFKPDGKRPTFCKDCLKDYQRMVAKEKLAQERKMQREQEETQPKDTQPQKIYSKQKFERRVQEKPQNQAVEKRFEHKAYTPTEKPLSLSQMQYIAPKKFKPQRNRPNVNLDEVRNLIKNTQENKNSVKEEDDDYEIDRRETGR
ncbi:MAG TPA: type IV secretion system DNA-binding domain-containing protein [Candidatus Moranbacteria bacterium]|nr:type IV secretion system DNA-binding domain-containing protein [Candidatus Moranbacteria bacterium]